MEAGTDGLAVFGLGERVEEGARNSNGRTDNTERTDWPVERRGRVGAAWSLSGRRDGNGQSRGGGSEGGGRRGYDSRLEGNNRGDDDDDALDGVADSVRHWVDTAQGEEGDFVIQVVEGAR